MQNCLAILCFQWLNVHCQRAENTEKARRKRNAYNEIRNRGRIDGDYKKTGGKNCSSFSWSIGIYKFPKKFLYWGLERGFPFPV
jgi:hypothetical protein